MSEFKVTKHLLPEKQVVCKVSHFWGIANYSFFMRFMSQVRHEAVNCTMRIVGVC